MRSGNTTLIALGSLSAMFAGCGTAPIEPMDLCYEQPEAMLISPRVLTSALLEAWKYSNAIYGEECLVCAELMPTVDKSFELHITNPFDDIMINTQAVVEFDFIDRKYCR